MKKYLFCLLFAFAFTLCFSQEFPIAKKVPNTLTRHGISFPDDYSWLEDMRSTVTKDWVAAENVVTNAHLDAVRKNYNVAAKIRDYDNFSSNSLPEKNGRYYYSYFRKDKKSSAGLYFREKLNDMPLEIVNISKIHPDADVAIMDFYPSRNSKYIAYRIRIDGSDVEEIRFANFSKLRDMEDVLTNVKYSAASWNGDEGVFYKKNANTSTFAQDSTYQLYYHKIGNGQNQDELIYDATKTGNYFSFFTRSNRLFVVETSKDETIKNYYSAILKNDEPIKLEKFIDNDTSGFQMRSYRNGRIIYSSRDFDWGEIRSFDINNRKDETVIVPQLYTHLLEDDYFTEDYIICKYRHDGKHYFIVYDSKGAFIRKFDVPYSMDFDFRFYDAETKDLFVSFFSYVIPFQNYRVNLETGKSDVYYNDFIRPKPTVFPFDYFETKVITYKSRDNKDIPITIIHKKGIPLDGNNPTLLKGYGGFGAVSGPSYDTGLLYFLEKGGVYAYAEVRGGGEKGLNWHKQGMGLKKINSSNDFIDAAEFLIREKYTCPNKLAITGGSQGGLLVAVAMTQRPELFRVAVPVVGVYDMAKFDQFTVGTMHLDEYGNPANKTDFTALMEYSPYHNIKEDVNYPTTLIITSENDDRVPPLHSYKFAARLQNRAAQKNSIYLQTMEKSGHYGKFTNYNDRVNSKAEFYSFILFHLQ
ncbi:MAG TPA: prolyl oligopeptidase family serine peptidase [Flavobacterium sp.]|nr:prolyl oligopeptidase family serine peptidase [Flavobacterium sp.]